MLPTDEAPASMWPLELEQRTLLAQLAELIRRFGAARFVEAPLVRADLRDFPDPWEPTLGAVHGVLYRLFWHAYIDCAIVVEDVRGPAPPDGARLTSSMIELADAGEGRAVFHVASIGNDDVAGALAHRVGFAFLCLAPPDPFRETVPDPTEADGSLAAVFLGLGVLAANAARYRRYVSEMIGNSVYSEEQVASAGGLEQDDLLFLLAVQDVVRGAHQDALATLRPAPAERFAQWRAALAPHRDELRTALALDDAPAVALSRASEPPQPAAHVAEPDRRKFNAGARVYRVPYRPSHQPFLGVAAGAFGLFLGPIVGAGTMAAGLFAGFALRPRKFRCSDPACERIVATEVATCPGCGGSVAATIAHANDRLARDEELDGVAPADPG